jgi:hypothetical protein
MPNPWFDVSFVLVSKMPPPRLSPEFSRPLFDVRIADAAS